MVLKAWYMNGKTYGSFMRAGHVSMVGDSPWMEGKPVVVHDSLPDGAWPWDSVEVRRLKL